MWPAERTHFLVTARFPEWHPQ